MPNLSFGFLAFNNWPILKRTLESAKKLQHTQGEVQWVIVDNSTPDCCSDMVKNIIAWEKEQGGIWLDTIFNNGVNGGEGAGMNQCFDACRADNILFFQDDWECVVDYPFVDTAIEILDRFNDLFMIQFSKRAWSTTNPNIRIGRVLHNEGDKTVFEMQNNGYGNNTFQVRMFKKERWQQVGPYLEDKDIGPQWKGHRPGSVSERDYGIRLQSLGYKAAKINDGQFIHTIAENARWNVEKVPDEST